VLRKLFGHKRKEGRKEGRKEQMDGENYAVWSFDEDRLRRIIFLLSNLGV
jgi:hypothetical protein